MCPRIRLAAFAAVPLLAGVAWLAIASHRPAERAPPERAAETAIDTDWWQTVAARIAREEYAATAGPRGLTAPNRAHHLRTTFGGHGVEIEPWETSPALDWRFVWETVGLGRGAGLRALSPVSAELDARRVIYRRPEFDEWYENSPAGLEQGFTIHARPPGAGPLRLSGRVQGSLIPAPCAPVGAVDFLDATGACVLRYGALQVRDAAGAEVPAHLALDGAELAIVMDDERAAYPVTVDPLMTSPAWTAESNQAFSWFGYSIATAGDVNGDGYSDVVVGAYFYDNGEADEGRAYVFHGSAAGLATTPSWTAEGDQVGASFGYAVATAGDVNGDGYSDLAVGAFRYDNGETDEGRVFVYHGSAAGLGAFPAWTAESNQTGAALGNAVAPAGDVNGDGFSDLIAGAFNYDNGQSDEGRAFVYHGSPSGLGASAAWFTESNQAGAHYGVSVATAGDVNGDGVSDVIVGASGYSNGQALEGRASVYHGAAAGLGLVPTWTAESNQAGASFGTAVATAGDVDGDGFSDVVVGAPDHDSGQTDEGRAFLYRGSPAGLAATPSWSAESNQAGAAFGISVAPAGDVDGDGYADVIAGARNYDNGELDEGRAFVYAGSAAGLSIVPVWTAESNQAEAYFGFSVATAGDVNGDGYSDVFVGGFSYTNGETDEGRAFAFHGSAAGLASAPAWSAESNQSDSRFGYSVASAGDVNGDGFGDVIVGAPQYDNGQIAEGRAYVYLGSATGVATVPAWTAESNQLIADLGWSVGAAGDVNGDGFGDVIVGAPLYDNGQSDEGRAYVYLGAAGGLGAQPAWIAEPDTLGAQFGIAVAGAGDVNGDGFADVIVGARNLGNGEPTEGRAFVYHGSPAGLSHTPAWAGESNQSNAGFGGAVSTAGDVNGDGFSDVLVGAPFFDNTASNNGRAYCFRGSAGGLELVPAWTADGDELGANFGYSVSTAGDVNGDGFSDVIIGARWYDNGQTDEGRAYVYHGSAAGLSAAAAWTAESNQAGALFGTSVATAGDVNGDGFSDVLVGAPAFANGQTREGRGYVYHGSALGLSVVASWTAEPDQAFAEFGNAVATAGDVNGDGFADVIIGAHLYDNGEADEGRAILYYGNAGAGRIVRPRQQRTDGMTPIAPLGRSDGQTEFRIRAVMLSIYGRTRLQMEHEVKSLGMVFDGTGTVPGTFTDSGSSGAVEFNRLVTGLTPGRPYHWRVRARYDLAKTPFQRHGPWLQVPVNGWNETDLRMAAGITALDPAAAPRAARLLASPRPNPFAEAGEVAYMLPRAGAVRLAVYDAAGRERAVLVAGRQDAGPRVARWDGRDSRGHKLPAGVYFVRLDFEGRTESEKLVIAR